MKRVVHLKNARGLYVPRTSAVAIQHWNAAKAAAAARPRPRPIPTGRPHPQPAVDNDALIADAPSPPRSLTDIAETATDNDNNMPNENNTASVQVSTPQHSPAPPAVASARQESSLSLVIWVRQPAKRHRKNTVHASPRIKAEPMSPAKPFNKKQAFIKKQSSSPDVRLKAENFSPRIINKFSSSPEP